MCTTPGALHTVLVQSDDPNSKLVSAYEGPSALTLGTNWALPALIVARLCLFYEAQERHGEESPQNSYKSLVSYVDHYPAWTWTNTTPGGLQTGLNLLGHLSSMRLGQYPWFQGSKYSSPVVFWFQCSWFVSYFLNISLKDHTSGYYTSIKGFCSGWVALLESDPT